MNAQRRAQVSARDAADATQRRVAGNSNGTWRKFAEPHSWALKWDGDALSRLEGQLNGHTPSAAG